MEEVGDVLHHVELNVSDLKASREFYDRLFPLLGYSLYQDWPEGFSYRQQGTYVVFVQTEARFLAAGYHRKSAGLNHIAFHAATTLQVDGIAEKMQQSGVRILYQDRHPYAGGNGTYAVFMEDPDRLKVEIIASESGGSYG